MIDLAAELKPKVIVEVGVHGALRGSRMISATNPGARYIGYDVFETRDMAFQRSALNGKGMPIEALARMRLDDACRRTRSTYTLVIGDTRETLHGKPVVADLAFIDGDHRVDAIEGDYQALAGSTVVVFDDYYRPSEGRMPDTRLYGANQTVDRLAAEGRDVEILPIGDVTADGGASHLAVVR